MNLYYEQKQWFSQKLVVGIDEVGRGCLAGPVVVGAVVFPMGQILIQGVNDSKKVSLRKREYLEPLIRSRALRVGIGMVEADEIDRIGIVDAIRKSADEALQSMRIDQGCVIVSDGPNPVHSPIEGIISEAVIDGDAKIYSIAAASIVAKVYRDAFMHQQAKNYARYGWETNVGYGTKKHLESITHYGLTPLHRKSYCQKLM